MTAPKPFPDVWAKACMSDVRAKRRNNGRWLCRDSTITVSGAPLLLASIYFSYIYELKMLYLVLFPMAVHYGFVDDDFC